MQVIARIKLLSQTILRLAFSTEVLDFFAVKETLLKQPF